MQRLIVLLFVLSACCIEANAQYMTARSIVKVKDTSRQEAKAKAKTEKQSRIAEQKNAEARAEAEKQARIAAQREVEAKAKAEEQARIAAQKEVKAKAKAEADAKRKQIAEKYRKEYAKVQKGFGSVVDVSYLLGLNYQFPSIGLTYTAGYRFNNIFYLGAGVGVDFNIGANQVIRSATAGDNKYNGKFLNPSLVSVPLFAYFRTNFLNRRCSPFFAIAAGGRLSAKQTIQLDLCDAKYGTSGIFVNPQVGVNFRTTTKTSIYFAAGFQCMTAPVCEKLTGYNASIVSKLCYGLNFHLGFTF